MRNDCKKLEEKSREIPGKEEMEKVVSITNELVQLGKKEGFEKNTYKQYKRSIVSTI